MLALTVADADLIAIIAVIVAIGSATPAWLTWRARKVHVTNSDKIEQISTWVKPNGHGTLTEMCERILTRLDDVEGRVADVERRASTTAATTAATTDRRIATLHADANERRQDLADVVHEMAQLTAFLAGLECIQKFQDEDTR